jgi:catechol 2,3-dioxygenase-like lactoylglutathione lyase family enzyme
MGHKEARAAAGVGSTEPRLEHVNVTATDVDATVHFFQTAMPELTIRGEGTGEVCERWVHLGTSTSYIAIEDRGVRETGPHVAYEHSGVNHLGFVVADSEAVARRLRAGGYREGKHNLDHRFRRRYYFYDPDDAQVEFVEYLTDRSDERNDYGL